MLVYGDLGCGNWTKVEGVGNLRRRKEIKVREFDEGLGVLGRFKFLVLEG